MEITAATTPGHYHVRFGEIWEVAYFDGWQWALPGQEQWLDAEMASDAFDEVGERIQPPSSAP